MKKYAKKIFCGIALCGIGILGGFGVNAVRGYAAEEDAGALANTYFEMEGASVRLSDRTGLRFTARLDAESYEAPTGADTESTQEKTVSYGVFIFPMDKLQSFMGVEYTKFQTYDANYKYLNEILTEENAKQYLKDYGIIDLECIPVPVDEDKDETPDYYRINGSITKVLYNNMGREFFGLAYKKEGKYEEDNASYSYEYTYANFEDKSNVWSLSYVSSAAYANGWEGSTKEDKNILQGFIKQALLKKAGVTEEVAKNVLKTEDFDWTLSLSQTATEMTVGAKESLTWQTSFTASGTEYTKVVPDLSVKYLSSAPSVVEVSADGTLSAISAGEATITASCMDKTATCTVTVSASEEPQTKYTITVNGGTADVYSATAGTPIKLTPNAPEEGQVFDTWEVEAEKEVVITDNAFTMPACNVQITAKYKAAAIVDTRTYLAFDNFGENQVDGSALEDNKALNIAAIPENQYIWDRAHVYATYLDITQGGKLLSFTVTNNSSTTAIFQIEIQGKGGGNHCDIESLKIDSAVVANGVTNDNYYGIVTVGGNEQIVVTVELAKEVIKVDNAGFRLYYYPYAVDKTEKNFTISKVYVGEYTAGPTKLATPVVNVNAEGLATWDAVDNATSYEYSIDGGKVQSTTTERAVELTDGQTIKVRACTTDTANYADSDWSAEVRYVAPDTTLYTITVINGKADVNSAIVDSAMVGTLIKLTPNDAPEGQVFDTWEVVADKEVVITGNTFTMPACNVQITATYKAEEAHEYLAFSSVGKNNLKSTTEVVAADDNKSMTVTRKNDDTESDYAYMKFEQFNTDELKEAAKTVTFTITNTSDTDMTICAGIYGKNGGSIYELTEVGGGTLNNKEKAVVSVGAGASVTVTIKMSRIDYDGYRLSFLLNDALSENVSSFTVSNVYIGG